MNNGILGEAKAIAYLLEKGYDVFNQFGGKAPFDLVAHKDNTLYRVSVKSTSFLKKNTYIVYLQRVRPNRTKNIIHKFDKTCCDLLAIYIVPEDRIVLLEASGIKQKCSLSIRRLAEFGNAGVLKTHDT